MPFIDVNNAQLYYEEHGEGDETIVFGHSMLFNLRMFDDQVEALKTNYRCVLFDFRGQGKSESTSEGYDLDNLTTDVLEIIKSLNCSPCHFVGFSMGGMVAMRLAARHPELIKSLILIDTSSEIEQSPNSLKNRMMLWIVKNIGLKPVSNQIMKMFFGHSFLNDAKRKDVYKTWRNHFLSNNRAVGKVVRGVLYRKAVTSELKNIHIPTLILWGDHDILTNKDKSTIMHENIRNSELKIIPEAGHMSPVEEPVLVNEMIKKFLAMSSN